MSTSHRHRNHTETNNSTRMERMDLDREQQNVSTAKSTRLQLHYYPLTALQRLYVYALHGYFTEILFTALWDFVVNRNWKFPGNTSIWVLPIYGISTLVIEKASIILTLFRVPLLVRALIYTVWTYSWEFTTGWVLKQFGACPWDYAPWFHGNFMGLVTLEYAPLWYMACIMAEKILIKYTLKLGVCSTIRQPNYVDFNVD